MKFDQIENDEDSGTAEMSASERVHAALRSRILKGDLRDGQRLVVREIAQTYSVSDLPVREAIRMLQSDGLCVVNRNRGACVTTITPEDIPGAYLLRGEVEALSTRLAGPNLSETDLAKLASMAQDMELLAMQDETEGYVAVNREFHALILARCPYANIRRMVEELTDGHFDYAVIFGVDTRELSRSSSHHNKLVDCLKAGDWHQAGAVSMGRKMEIARTLLIALNRPVPPELYSEAPEAGNDYE
ncbi:GntR family transcriptional regulator [Mycolicibacterium hippocampi]